MTGVVDYGLGNLFSLHNALKYLGIPFKAVLSPSDAQGAERLILPGVGAFPEGMRRLRESGMAELLRESKIPLLGICLGMQLLFDESGEFGSTEGLGLIPGNVVRLPQGARIPHMGWNALVYTGESPLFCGVPEGSFVYFVHSYRAQTGREYVSAACDYAGETVAAVRSQSVYGVQFHPEKSGSSGLKILKNFCEGEAV